MKLDELFPQSEEFDRVLTDLKLTRTLIESYLNNETIDGQDALRIALLFMELSSRTGVAHFEIIDGLPPSKQHPHTLH